MIHLAAAVLDTINRHAATTYPHECCGALLGTIHEWGDVDVVHARELDNVTEEGPRRRFLVSPKDYREAEAEARRRGADLVGFYHSHPDHPAEPSLYDLEHAWPNLSYVIVAVANGRPGAMRSWRLRDDRSAFEEEPQR
jgi:proteasome lid subunit RPN8/RPN11